MKNFRNAIVHIVTIKIAYIVKHIDEYHALMAV